MMRRWVVLSVAVYAVLMAAAVRSTGCSSGEITIPTPCEAGPSPSGVSTARIYAPVRFEEDGAITLEDAALRGGHVPRVLPGGRILSPITAPFGQLGFPVNIVMHPTLSVAYVVDMDYAGADYNARCSTQDGLRVRGVHVIDVGSRIEIQRPADIQLPTPSAQTAFASANLLCPTDAGDAGDSGPKFLSPHDTSFGIAITQHAPYRLYVATGVSGSIYEFSVNGDGTLTPSCNYSIGGYPTGVALSADEQRLWVVQFVSPGQNQTSTESSQVIEVPLGCDAGTGRQLQLPVQGGYGIAALPSDLWDSGYVGPERLFVSGFRGGSLYALEPDLLDASPDSHSLANCGGGAVASIDAGANPEAVVLSPDGTYLYVTASDDDRVLVVRTSDCAVVASAYVGLPLTGDPDAGAAHHGSSATALALDPGARRLYVACASDNAVTVLSTEPTDAGATAPPGPPSLAVLGGIPVGFYPTALAVAGGNLLVTNGKGLAYDWEALDAGSPDAADATSLAAAGFRGEALQGSLLVAPTAEPAIGAVHVARDLVAPSLDDPFTCQQSFPVPLTPSGGSPIQHIILIVRENKTYDFLLGGTDGDPKGDEWQIDSRRRAVFGQETKPLVPNIQALAAQYASATNFYDNSEVSMVGHAWLTASFVNDYLERAYTEGQVTGDDPLKIFDFANENGYPPGTPAFGTFFTHLLANNVNFTVLGELVGVFGSYADQYVVDHLDVNYPVFDLGTSDTTRVDEAIKLFNLGADASPCTLPPFVYMELMRDHTQAMTPGAPTPAYMIAENDAETGRFVDAVSHSQCWSSTAIFIVEDDPQQGFDHVDYHRSICVVASPWVTPNHKSNVQYAYPSLFRTFELILGIGPMNRFDAFARPMRDMFAAAPTASPYSYQKSGYDLMTINATTSSLEAFVSSQIDFSRPDQSDMTGELVWYSLTNEIRPGSRLAKLHAQGITLPASQHVDP